MSHLLRPHTRIPRCACACPTKSWERSDAVRAIDEAQSARPKSSEWKSNRHLISRAIRARLPHAEPFSPAQNTAGEIPVPGALLAGWPRRTRWLGKSGPIALPQTRKIPHWVFIAHFWLHWRIAQVCLALVAEIAEHDTHTRRPFAHSPIWPAVNNRRLIDSSAFLAPLAALLVTHTGALRPRPRPPQEHTRTHASYITVVSPLRSPSLGFFQPS
ncbi:hypothetical protein GQ54DRAFT_207126 [Martensiomyces pterosporus]|nr:hypothetical protein GQ54DRAFT_207126 [Martensiomyces pterosporus]